MKLSVLFTLVALVVVYGKSISRKNENLKELEDSLNQYFQTGVRPPNLDSALEKNKLPYIFRKIESGQYGLEQTKDIDCDVCFLVVDYLIETRRVLNVSIEVLKDEAIAFCTLLELETFRVCEGVVEINANIFVYMVDSNPTVDARRTCDVIIPTCSTDGEFEWTVDIPEGKTIEKSKPSGSDTFNILHISDFHYDPNYVAGKTNQCNEPVCCQYDDEDGDEASGTSCGYWTDYQADSPESLVDEVFRQVQNHEFEYVYYTGDIVSHRVWETSQENVTKDIRTIYGKFREHLGVPVFPVLGNHEPHPVNIWFSKPDIIPEFSTQWLFDVIQEEWSEWLDDGAKETLLKGGFYTISPKEGFRIIALNSNVAYVSNWWLIDDDVDPYGQLAWLAKVLKEAEDNDEKVHILQHIPSGSNTAFPIWSREYNKIINRFANTIAAQFTGHTHKDEFYIYYNNSDPSQAINMAWNGASVVPYTGSNPSYKLYNVDSNTFDILDQEEWTFDLLEANQVPENSPNWYQLYSFKNAYGVDNLEAQSISDLAVRMAKNHTLIDEYNRFKFRNSPVRGECDESCQKGVLCTISTSYYKDQSHCESLKQIYDESK